MNQDSTDCIQFAPLLQHTINNLGDPFSGTGGHLESFKYERKLVKLMADLFKLEEDNAWGYYSSGSSISNLQAIYFGNLKNGKRNILVTSEDAHNSVEKAGMITQIDQTIFLKTNAKGEIDINKFREFLSKQNHDNRYIFCFCSGSVCKGAYDDVPQLIEVIKEFNIPRENYYLHLDAALGGLITPFLKNDPLHLDFRIKELDSMTVSFHKRLGIPVPGSMFLARKSNMTFMDKMAFVEDYSSFDTTIPGSRDGLSPFITYVKMKALGKVSLQRKTSEVIEKAQWFSKELTKRSIDNFNNKFSPCVYFEAPNQSLRNEYHLPLYKTKSGKEYTHIFTMEHVLKSELQKFLDKYSASINKAFSKKTVNHYKVV